MNAIDVTSLVIIFFCSISAFFKGAFGELISLASLALGYFLYRAIAPYLLSSINIGFPFSIIFDIILMSLSIFLVSFILHQATHKIRQEYSSASSDMLAGMALGAVKGYVIVVIIFSLLFDLLTDKQVFTGEIEEREGVPAFLYRARSYNFLRDSYVAFNPVMRKMFAAMKHRDTIGIEEDSEPEDATAIDTLLQRTQQHNLQRYGGRMEQANVGMKTTTEPTNKKETLQIKINDYTVNIDPQTNSLQIESNEEASSLLHTLGFGQNKSKVAKDQNVVEDKQNPATVPEVLTEPDIENLHPEIMMDAEEADVEAFSDTEVNDDIELLNKSPKQDQSVIPALSSSKKVTIQQHSANTKSNTKTNRQSKATAKSKVNNKESLTSRPAFSIDDIISRELKR